MAVDSRFIEDLKSRLTLSNIIGRKVKLTRKGNRHLGLCPFHGEKTPSFNVTDDKEFFHCFGCGEHGDAISFVQKTEGVTFMEAVSILANEAGMKMPVLTQEEVQKQETRASLYEVAESACQYFQKELVSNSGKQAYEYVQQRKMTQETLMEFRIGYADNGTGIIEHLKSCGFDEQSIIDVGLANRGNNGMYAFFRDRLMFPITDIRGRVIAFGGRFMGDAKEKGVGKYINSPETPLFDKSRVIYNLKNARKSSYDMGKIIVCEGYMDVIALHQAGFPYGVAPMGTALTEEHIMQGWKSVDVPILCFDGDEAGQKAAQRSVERICPILTAGKSVKIAFMPDGLDPDDVIKQQGVDRMAGILDDAKPLVDYLWETAVANNPASTPEELAKLEKHLKDIAFSIGDKNVSSNYLSAFNDLIFNNFKRKTGKSSSGRKSKYVKPLGASAMKKVNMPKSQQKIVLAGLLNHPNVFFDVEEIIIDFFDEQYSKLFNSLCSQLLGEEINSENLIANLKVGGYEKELSDILNNSTYMLAKNVAPSGDFAECKKIIIHIIDVVNKKAEQQVYKENIKQALLNDEEDANQITTEAKLSSESIYKDVIPTE
ncbi:MAG: DNA primase [Alphaproteobacteria bacterium]